MDRNVGGSRALSHAGVLSPARDHELLPYLRDGEPWGLDIALEVRLNGQLVSRPPFRDMYWTPAQMLTHHASNGCNLRPGDLLASGTVSGPDRGTQGCMLELTRRGAEPVVLPTGEERKFLHDGDEITMRAYLSREGAARIGLGECSGLIVASTSK